MELCKNFKICQGEKTGCGGCRLCPGDLCMNCNRIFKIYRYYWMSSLLWNDWRGNTSKLWTLYLYRMFQEMLLWY